MKIALILFLAAFIAGCYVPPPELPRQELPRQELPRPETQPQAKGSALTPGMIKKHIEAGKTTQGEVMEIFGPPDMITKSGRGEMWGYDKVSREVAEAAVGAKVGARSGAASTVGAGGLGLVGGAGGVIGGILGGIGGSVGQSAQQSSQQAQDQRRRTETTTTVFLLVYFDEKGLVTDYRLSATKF